jgi:6-phosphofructokinase 2
MSKIVTLTVNPALDKSAKVDGLIPEQKLTCHSIDHQPGGGGINISRILKRLGESSVCFFTSGGENGKRIESLLHEESINTYAFQVQNSTRENFSVVDTATNFQYRFGMPGKAISDNELKTITTKIVDTLQEGDILALSGSLTTNMPSDFYVNLIKLLKSKHVKIVLDTSGPALKQAIEHQVCLVKPNLRELAYLAGKDFLTNKEQEDFAMQLVKAKKVEYVVVSMGPKGAFMASEEGIVYQQTPAVPVKSTVGAGDSMVAGLIYGMRHNFEAKKMLQYGVACGSATTMSEGTNLASIENIQKTLELLS